MFINKSTSKQPYKVIFKKMLNMFQRRKNSINFKNIKKRRGNSSEDVQLLSNFAIIWMN